MKSEWVLDFDAKVAPQLDMEATLVVTRRALLVARSEFGAYREDIDVLQGAYDAAYAASYRPAQVLPDRAALNSAVNVVWKGPYLVASAYRSILHPALAARREDANLILETCYRDGLAFVRFPMEKKWMDLHGRCLAMKAREVMAALRRLGLTEVAGEMVQSVDLLGGALGLTEHQPTAEPPTSPSLEQLRSAIREWQRIVMGTVRLANPESIERAATVLWPLHEARQTIRRASKEASEDGEDAPSPEVTVVAPAPSPGPIAVAPVPAPLPTPAPEAGTPVAVPPVPRPVGSHGDPT